MISKYAIDIFKWLVLKLEPVSGQRKNDEDYWVISLSGIRNISHTNIMQQSPVGIKMTTS